MIVAESITSIVNITEKIGCIIAGSISINVIEMMGKVSQLDSEQKPVNIDIKMAMTFLFMFWLIRQGISLSCTLSTPI